MTAADWQRLLQEIGDRATDRKLRLFAVACCRRIAPALLHAAAWRALVVAEKMADALATNEAVEEARRRLEVVLTDMVACYTWMPQEYAAAAPLSCLDQFAASAARYAVRAAWRTSQPARDAVWAADTQLRLRDIFGNPSRPVTFDPSWRTDTVVSLARGMYESRDFSAMPILADALQDAGCEHPDILSHCRDPRQVHVRGCWVVDLVLGKS